MRPISSVTTVLIATILTACVGTGRSARDDHEAARATDEPARPRSEVVTPDARPSELPTVPEIELPARAVAKTYNVTFTARDLPAATARASALLREHGADLMSMSTNVNNGNINARAAVSICASLPAALHELGYPATSESAGENDMRPAVRQIQVRLRQLAIAERELARLAREATDPDALEGVMVLRELSANERRNQEAQLVQYATQTGYCQIYVNFQKVG